MADTTTLSNAVAIAGCDAMVDMVDVGSGTAKLRIYDGTQPTNPDVAITSQTLLAEIDLPNPAYGAAVDGNPGGVATLQGTPLTDSSADASGTASWFRIINRNGDAVIDGSIGTSNASMIVGTTTVTSGAAFTVDSGTFTMPET